MHNVEFVSVFNENHVELVYKRRIKTVYKKLYLYFN